MERAKRNSVKKWDPDFVTSTPISSASKCVVAVDSAVYSSVENDLKMVQDKMEEPAAKRPARKSCSMPEASDGPANSIKTEWRRACVPCSKMSCSKSEFTPTCFVDVTERCAHKTGWTCRWYHVSLGEHYCNDCFDYFYRATKVGYKSFIEWKKNWLGHGCADPGIKQYFVDQYLPYWTQCNQCSKWRRVSKDTIFTSEFVASYVCSNECGVSGCDETEDRIVKAVKECDWLNLLLTPPLLINSPSAPFLVNYPPDSVGLSASSLCKSGVTDRSSDVDGAKENFNLCTSTVFIPTVKGVSEYLQPFSQPQVDIFYGSLPANRMTCNEQQHLPQYAREQPLYLSMRNVILALWAMNPKQVLTPKLCIQHFLCRGLARIHCAIELPAVLQYLTFNNYVNVGVISGCLFDVFPSLDLKTRVIVIGAGPAGLAAAHKLSKYGMQVTLLEARNRLGGRVSDEIYGDICVGLGAQFINGCFNNPFALLALQTDCKLAEVHDRCCLINEAGELIETDVDSQLDCHFESMLERVSRWKDQSQPDCSLLDKLMELHQAFQAETNVSFQQAEENLFYFHIANVEHASGASLSQVSAKHWDHNEEFTQFDGPLCSLPSGYSKLLEKIAASLDIRLNMEVTHVSYGDSGVTVTTNSGQQFESDSVIITVPLSLLKQRRIEFSPELPDWKLKAIDTLGVGMLEKVILSFERKFWADKVGGCDFFGRVPSQLASRGLFSVFHDVTSRSEVSSSTSVLVTFVSGDSIRIISEKSDAEIVELCMESLRALFPEEKVPDPISYYVTHWQKDEFAAMSYSYTPVNCSGDVYDKLAAPVSNQIFFAGEATNRAHPQTVTGAYLSGLRAADNILHPFIR